MTGIVLRSRPSAGARALATAAGFRLRRLRAAGPLRWPRGLRLQVNWGSTQVATHPGSRVLNPPAAVRNATDKLVALRTMQEAGVPVPPFWGNRDAVERGERDIIVVRTMLRASEGRGIQIVRPGEELPRAPLYTKYIRKNAEYRVHVGNGQVLAIQQKRLRNGADPTADGALVRNHDNGWIFAIENVEFVNDRIRNDVTTAAVNAVRVLDLDFGAVDIVVSRQREPQCFVLEVNTAPGIESPTILAAYSQYLQTQHAAA